MSDIPRVSVVVKSYNYARFLPDAIDSALAQSYPHIEVVVVDDGSTDESREVIARYGDRVIPVLKENGGEMSAFNAGFATSRGEVVIFLDADDRLLPHIVERVMEAFKAEPNISKVQYRLEDIDATGRLTGTFRPPAHVRMPSGDIRPSVLKYHAYHWPPTSGNAFPAWVLRRILPVPEDEHFRDIADEYLAKLSPLFGPITSLDGVGAQYRIHGANYSLQTSIAWDRSAFDVERVRREVAREYRSYQYVGEFADTLGLASGPGRVADALNIRFLVPRIISYKLDRSRHPIADDRLLPLAFRGIAAACVSPDFSWRDKVRHILWFTAMVPSPTPVAGWLGKRLLYPEKNGKLQRLRARWQRPPKGLEGNAVGTDSIPADALVSIVVNNYNYARFLPDAIDSALAQSYPHIEVVVVDDGSTDESREVIARYGDRVIPVLKENGGQASAFNAGFATSRGEVVIFLDADDRLLPHIVERVMDVFRYYPDTTLVQYRMAVIDAKGKSTGAFEPPAHIQMQSGDFRGLIMKFNNCVWYMPTSANAFPRSVLRRILPVPVPATTSLMYADYYLSRASALCGPIVSIDEVGAHYRHHGTNLFNVPTVNLDRHRHEIVRTIEAHRDLKRIADSLGLVGYSREATNVSDVPFLAHRVISLKMERERHPIKGDRLPLLSWHGLIAALQRPDLSLLVRFFHALWFITMLPAPKPLARWLAEKLFHPETRKGFNKLLTGVGHREIPTRV